jgi:phosphoglycolate phosphatase-like HAD superfamily hydrolase
MKGGAQIIAVASGKTSAPELREAGASTVLNNLADTPQLIQTVDAP